MGERKQMTDNDVLKTIEKHITYLEKISKGYDFSKKTEEEIFNSMKYDFGSLVITTAIFGIFCKSNMQRINKIENAISKLPNDKKYQELKDIIKKRDDDIEKTIIPLSNYSKALDESRKMRPDYIG